MVHKIGIDQLTENFVIDRVVILSLMPSLYSARLEINGQTHLLIEKGSSIRRPSAEGIKRVFSRCRVARFTLLHASAYDEMVGQGVKVENSMEIPG
ncbi:MAG: hypothetical protein RI942_1024 [Pseudomonadota bacterium]|jgi:hypothetical protein